jgi:hypothetical protein
MTYQSGSAIAYYILDISDAEHKAAQLRSIYQGIRQDASSLAAPLTANTGNGSATAVEVQATAMQQAAVVATTFASETQALIASTIELGVASGLTTDQIDAQLAAMSREALASGDLVAANELQDAALGAQIRLIQQHIVVLEEEAVAQYNVTEAQIASVSGGKALSSGLASLVSPIALVTAGLAAGAAVLNSFDNALHEVGQFQEARVAFGGIIGNIAEGNVVIDQAIQKTRDYGITEKQTTEAFRELAPYIKDSTSSIDAQAGSLERIVTLNPSEPAKALASAIEGINSGRITNLRRELGLSSEAATNLVTSVKGGQDIFIALNTALDQQGFTLQVARDRMQGYAGAEIEARLAGEDLEKAQARFALGPGLGLKQAEIATINTATDSIGFLGNVLKGNFVDAATAAKQGIAGFAAGLETGNPLAVAFGRAIDKLTGASAGLAATGQVTASTIQREADADDRYTASTLKAVNATDALTHAQYVQNAQALQDQRAGERSGGTFDTVDEATNFYDKQHVASAQAAQDAKDLQQAELGYAKATKNTVAERKILNDELKAANGDHAKELDIKAQIYELDHRKEKNTTSKGLSGLDRSEIKLAGDLQAQLDEVNRRLANSNLTQQQRNQLLIQQGQLQEKINDAMQKERDLQTNIALDAVHDQQKRIAEARELDGLRRAENSTRFSAAQQVAIRLREQEILLEQQKRSNDITKENYDLNKSIKESGVGAAQVGVGTPQGGASVSQVPPIGSALPVGAQGAIPQVQLANGKQPINITINIDKEGKATVAPFDAGVTLKLIGNAFGAAVAAGGLP